MKRALKSILLSLFFAIGFAIAFSMNVRAYIDPSVMTYAIQAVAGIVIAVGAVVGIYFRKMKKKVNEKLGVEEKKEIETDEIIVK